MALNQGYTSTRKLENDKSYTVTDSGPYIGIVKENRDPTRMGRLGVVIPAIHGAQNVKTDQLISCEYLAPFYGAKSPETVNYTGPTNYINSQHSYGMWMVPPDIDTRVLVIFAEGKITNAYWIGCIQEPFVNQMTPGLASSDKSYPDAPVLGDFTLNSVEQSYGQKNVPVAEVNRGDFDKASAAGFDKLLKPIPPLASTLRDQGLIQDDIRGNTSSSARRESPSNVFGVSTPGPIDQRANKTDKLGTTDNKRTVKTARKAGHTFVMDDGDEQGENQLVRLRTSSGHQLLMHDSAGVMYLANADGTVWMEFSNNGIVDVYAQTGYNLRSGADINFHAEGNINMYANKSIKIKANEESGTVSIDGSNILNLASENITSQGNNVYTKATKNIVADAGQRNIQQGLTRVDLIGGQVHFNSFGTISNLVTPLQRTSYTQPFGTGTALTTYPDVSLQPLGTVLKIDRALPGMSGMRVPTHEPFWGHQDIVPAFGSVGGTNTAIGTAGFIENSNRNADLMSVRWAQYKADLDLELAKDQTKSVDSISSLFNVGYSNTFGTSSNFLNDKLIGYISLAQGVSETYNQIVSGVSTGGTDNTVNVLVNETGVLYTRNANKLVKTTSVDKVTGKLGKVNSTVSTVNNILQSTQGNNEGIVPGVGVITNNFNNVSTVTDTYKNVVGGNITAVTQVKSAVSTVGTVASKIGSVAKSIGKKFGF